MRYRPAVFLTFLPILFSAAWSQAFSEDERLQGYAVRGSDLWFVFDEIVYGRTPSTVVVTGSFRGWSQDMSDATWQLRRVDGGGTIWALRPSGPGAAQIGANTPFKYRVDNGQWVQPPRSAPNQKDGNLHVLPGSRPSLKAEIRGPRSIWMTLTGEGVQRSLDPDDYRLTNADGVDIPIDAILPNTFSETLIVPAVELDIRRVYYLDVPAAGLRAVCRRDPWFRTLYSSKQLGAEMSPDGGETTFRIFAPRAQRVQLYLYLRPFAAPNEAAKVVEMTPDADGIWEATEIGDHHGVYYDFRVYGPRDPGNAFYDSNPVHVSDPYARVNVDAFGKSRVWRPTTPAPPLENGRPPMEDVIAYEVHVQDFTDLLPVPDNIKGTMPAMVKPGVRNSRRVSVGFDYLVDLGINVVHLMPVQEYLHYPDDEWQDAFRNDPYMIEQGINLENYQWGYRTTHAFAIETRYRSRDSDIGAQRDQFRDLVKAFHEKGIAVIIDIVPNHTGENMDGRNYSFNFNVLDKPYYYRTDESFNHIGPFGNEIKTEDRPMVQRWIIDQCKHFVREFGIDGFRIDLAGQVDEQTLLRLKAELPEDLIIYGEPWIAISDPEAAANPDWSWYKADAPITYFQDDTRNAFQGPPDNPQDKRTDRGYAGGNADLRSQVMQALTNSFEEEGDPNRGINYLDIHDNWTMADRFATRDWDGRLGVDETRFKIAATLLLTSLGPVVIHGGTEMMRSKGLAPLEELVKRTRSGPLYFHGKRDTYNLRNANHFVWENVGVNADAPGVSNNYQAMIDFWKGLISLRRSSLGKVFRVGTRPPADYYRWILPADPAQIGYLVDGRVLVLINVGDSAATLTVPQLPAGTWLQIGDAFAVDHVNGVAGSEPQESTGGERAFTVDGPGVEIWALQ